MKNSLLILLTLISLTVCVEGGWELIEAAYVDGGGELISEQLDTHNWYNATVPGTVLTTLVEQGIYPDPLYGLNNMVIPDILCRIDWWYRTEFPEPTSKSAEKVFLLLNGINYAAEVWFNGEALGSLKGAFIREFLMIWSNRWF